MHQELTNPVAYVLNTCVRGIGLTVLVASIRGNFSINEFIIFNVLKRITESYMILKLPAFETENRCCKTGAASG